MCWLITLVVVLEEETALQRFQGAADEDSAEVGGEQRALARLEQVAEDARDYAAHAKAPNTLKAYRIDWADFSEWCALHRLEFLPATPQTVALYLTDLARTHKVSTLYRRLSGISQAHQAAGYVTPTTDAQVHLVRADLIALVGFHDRSHSTGRFQKLIRPGHWGHGDFQSAAIEPHLPWAFAPLGRRPRPLVAFSHGPNELRHERNMLDSRVASKKHQQVLSYLNWPERIAERAAERRQELELLACEMSLEELKSITWLGYDLDPGVLQEVIAAKEQGHEFPKRPQSHAKLVREGLRT